jgi:hypothetical protein
MERALLQDVIALSTTIVYLICLPKSVYSLSTGAVVSGDETPAVHPFGAQHVEEGDGKGQRRTEE